MVRHLSDKGFTLVEMLLVLLILSILLLLTPMIKKSNGILLRLDVLRIQELSTAAQAEALRTHTQIPIVIQGNHVQKNGEVLLLHPSTSCDFLRFHYTAQGTISKAYTLRCRCEGAYVDLVAQLGSGQLYVR